MPNLRRWRRVTSLHDHLIISSLYSINDCPIHSFHLKLLLSFALDATDLSCPCHAPYFLSTQNASACQAAEQRETLIKRLEKRVEEVERELLKGNKRREVQQRADQDRLDALKKDKAALQEEIAALQGRVRTLEEEVRPVCVDVCASERASERAIVRA